MDALELLADRLPSILGDDARAAAAVAALGIKAVVGGAAAGTAAVAAFGAFAAAAKAAMVGLERGVAVTLTVDIKRLAVTVCGRVMLAGIETAKLAMAVCVAIAPALAVTDPPDGWR